MKKKTTKKEIRKGLSKPMQFYKTVFVKHKIHKQLSVLRDSKGLKSLSDAVELLIKNQKKHLSKK